MSGYNNIDTDMGIATILGNFESDAIEGFTENLLENRFRPYSNAAPNYADIYERQFNLILANGQDYAEKINYVKSETYQEIIKIICKFYNLTFTGSFEDIQPNELYGITSTLYDIFISNFTNHMIDFFTSYIINNADDISNYLNNSKDPTINKPKETGIYDPSNFIDSKFIIITNNLNKVIINMCSYDITLSELFNYLTNPVIGARLSEIFADNGDIYKNHYAFYITNDYTLADMATLIGLEFRSRVHKIVQINVSDKN